MWCLESIIARNILAHETIKEGKDQKTALDIFTSPLSFHIKPKKKKNKIPKPPPPNTPT